MGNNDCGVLCWSPAWMQKHANSKVFLAVYGLLGTVQAMGGLYFAVTLTTIEKRFKIPSQTTGIILSGNEVSQILLSLILSYAGGRRNRPMWMAWGVVFSSLSCFILAIPHFIYGAGEDALQLTQEWMLANDKSISANVTSNGGYVVRGNDKLCHGTGHNDKGCGDFEGFTYVPLVLIFLSQFVLGIGNTLYFSLGQAYLDDNTKKTNTPMMLAYAFSLRMFGPFLGFGLGYLMLTTYIDPTKTPLIDKKDPRWLGAWWLGWIFLGTLMIFFAILLGMFPKELPKKRGEVQRVTEMSVLNKLRSSRISLDGEVIGSVAEFPIDDNFSIALVRLLKNKLLMFNITAGIFYILGTSGYMTFLSKYMEVQFNKTSADATIITGPVTILAVVVGFLVSGVVISKYKPRPKYLFFWNIIGGVVFVAGQISYTLIQCQGENPLVRMGDLSNLTNVCNSGCACDGVPYSPVCNIDTQSTYFSPCHAGCTSWDEKTRIYSNCTCGTFINRHWRPQSTIKPTTTQSSSTVTERILTFRPINESDGHQTTVGTSTTIREEFARMEREYSEGVGNGDENYYYDDEPVHPTDTLGLHLPVNTTPGACADGCLKAFYTFTIISLFINWLAATGKIGNLLLNFRAVAQEDKAFSQGLALTLISLLALIPGPILYGWIIDSTCQVWSYKCGERGNCQLYNKDSFRYYMNVVAIGLTSVGVFFDTLVWHYGRDLDLYGEKDEKVEKSSQPNPQASPLLTKRI